MAERHIIQAELTLAISRMTPNLGFPSRMLGESVLESIGNVVLRPTKD